MTAVLPGARRTPRRRIDGRTLLCGLTWRMGPTMCAANTLGAVGVFLFLAYVLPYPDRLNAADEHHAVTVNLIAFISYMIVAALVGWLVSAGRLRPIRRWLREGAEFDDQIRSYVLRHPLRQALVNGVIWLVSEAVFIPLNAPYGAAATADIATAILLGGVTTCAISYFVAERLMRPITEAVMDGSAVPDPYVPGVKTRLIIAWALGTGVPLVGIVLLVLDRRGMKLSPGGVLFLAFGGLVAGAVSMAFAARSVADPVESVTAALARVETGDFDAAVPVYDGSQVGKLQSGFNNMVEGLREREQIRDLFGRQVGEDVAAQALERGTNFRGEAVPAAVLFIDVIGSTTLAATERPEVVVERLNEFFGVVVDVVGRTGGFVNKFEGDAALCLYGAPTPLEDAPTSALLAARLLRERLRRVRGLDAAIGVAAGTVVAGNVGTAERYEYTVIGDPVNQAARLCDLAKSNPAHVLAASEVVGAATPQERDCWRPAGEQVLRGRTEVTQLAAPVAV